MPRQLKCVKCIKVDHSSKNVVYILVATFAGGLDLIENRYIGKTVTDLSEFRKNVLQLSSNLNNSSSSSVQLPDLKEKKGLMGGWKDDRNRTSVDDFCQHLVKLPSEILQDKNVIDFFLVSSAADEESVLKLTKNQESAKRQPKEKGRGDAAIITTTTASSSSPAVMSDDTMNSASANPSYSINMYEEIGYSSNSRTPSNLPITSIYSEVKLGAGDARCIATDGYADYVSVVPTASTSSAIKTAENKKAQDQTNKVTDEQKHVYGSVRKPKFQPQTSNDASSCVLYDDASCCPEPQPDSELYEDAISINSQRPVPPRPNLAKISTSSDTKAPAIPAKLPSPPVSASMPLTPIPPMPHFPSPVLQSMDVAHNDAPKGNGTGEEIQVVAISDYNSTADNVLSFKKGTLASLVIQSDSNWWCVQLGSVHGWVPAAYWRTLNSGECANLITKGNSPWFVGKLSRAECETLLMEHGKQQHFVVRESNNGHYALSVKYDDKIHHFPIEVTPDKKYNIGRYDFKTVNNIILYYQKNTLFNSNGQDVTLGSPLVIIRH